MAKILNYDLECPIDKSIEDFEYLYRCGNRKSEVERYFFVPEDFYIFYPKIFVFDNQIRELFDKIKSVFQFKTNDYDEYGQLKKEKTTIEYYHIQRKDIDTFNLNYDNASFFHDLLKRDELDENNYFRDKIAPTKCNTNIKYCKLAVESQIYQTGKIFKTSNAQIRKKYEIIHQFTEEELDEFDKFVLENEE